MNKVNVCYLHKQESNKWEWFLADDYSRALIKCREQFNNIEEAKMDYDLHHEELETHLTIMPRN
jgi:hypothetical protein